MLMAAALSFYAVVSLVPLCVIGLWFLSRFVGVDQAYYFMSRLVEQYVASGSDRIMSELDLIWQQGSTLLTGGLLGLLPLVWAGLGFYETLERILTEAWAGQPLRGFLHRKLVTLVTFLCAFLFFGASVATSTFLASLKLGWFYQPSSALLPFVLSVAMFFLLYKFLPNANVPSNLAFKAALVAGVLWEVSKGLFANLIEASAAQRGLIYGSLTGVMVLMFWIFVSGIILLLGAELAAAYHFAEEGERCATDQTTGDGTSAELDGPWRCA